MSKETAGLEAVLFAAGDPVSVEQLRNVLEKDMAQVEDLLNSFRQELDERGSGLTLRQVAGGWQLVTRPEYFHTVERLTEVVDRKISTPTMETLSIIAFKQPITKQEIEQIRGVRVERALAKLLELELICEKGRKPVIGHPILYGTTDVFLKSFGLNGLEDLPVLPSLEEAREGLDPEQLQILEGSENPEVEAEDESENAAEGSENKE